MIVRFAFIRLGMGESSGRTTRNEPETRAGRSVAERDTGVREEAAFARDAHRPTWPLIPTSTTRGRRSPHERALAHVSPRAHAQAGGGRRRAFLLARYGDARARIRARRVRVGPSDPEPADGGGARKAARRPVRASSPGFSGAGGVRGFVGDAARGASAPARAAEGGTDVPSRGGEPKKKRRGKNRRRAPRKNDRASSLESRSDEASDEASDIGSFSPSSGAAALAIAASVDPDAATVARFMGTIDEPSPTAALLFSATDEPRPEPRPRRASLDSARPDSGAVFMGTVDDDEMTVDFLLTGAKTKTSSKTKTPSNSERRAAPTRSGKNAAEKKGFPPRAAGRPRPRVSVRRRRRALHLDVRRGRAPRRERRERRGAVQRGSAQSQEHGRCVGSGAGDDRGGRRPAESTCVAIMLVCRDTAAVPPRAVEVYDAMKLVGVAPTKRSFDLAMTCAIRARRPRTRCA